MAVTKNQVRVLYAGGAWFACFAIFKLGSVPGGWDLLGETIGYVIGYSAFTAVPILLILYFSAGKKKAAVPATLDPPTVNLPVAPSTPKLLGQPGSGNAEHWYQKALCLTEESQQAECVSCLQRSLAADANHVRSLYGIAHHYLDGSGVEADPGRALDYFQRAAELGYPPAQDKLGLMYEHGKGVAKNLRLAEAWYRKAAEMRFADAQYHLGVLYGNGDGVSPDYIESTMWCRRAAEQGHLEAQATLGRIYMEGLDGVPKSSEEAAKWLRKAAENGDAESQVSLGLLFEYGRGVGQDLEEAARLYAQAADQEHDEGQAHVERLEFYQGRHTKSLDPLPGEGDFEFRARRLAESTRFQAPQERQ